MRKITLFLLLILSFLSTGFGQNNASDLFISEYCEYNQTVSTPQYFNHYIEIYNGTGDSIDLSKYQLWRSFNANGWNNNAGTPVEPINLRGKLATNQTYVITRTPTVSTPISIEADSSQSCTYLNISGDDAIALTKDDGTGNYVIIDLIGNPTVDPGEFWSVAGVANGTQNMTLVRKTSVCSPDTNWTASAGTTAENSEWIVKTQNDISDIGKHTNDCAGIVIPTADSLSVKALFIGNSYIYTNDLPLVIKNMAKSTGDELIYDQSVPGGVSLQEHFALPVTHAKIKSKFWDYVIFQEQSQRPALPIETVELQTFPYAHKFDSIVKLYNPCAQSMYYMTWGRKDGDVNNCPTYPAVCTYNGMDSLLRLRYTMMKEMNGGVISPVGAVWHYIRDHHPEIELYNADKSHPSVEGTYAAACTFYTALFKKDPLAISYDFTLSDTTAEIIRKAAKIIVYDSLSIWNTYTKGASDSISISLDSPTEGELFDSAAPVNINVTANTTVGSLDEIQVFVNGILVGTGIASPYEVNVTPTAEGSYLIIVTATNSNDDKNCARVKITVKYADVVPTDAVETETNLHSNFIYPNPANNMINLCLEGDFTTGKVQIINLSGQVVSSGAIVAGENSINIEQLPTGTYIIAIQAGDIALNERFIKK